MRMYKLYVQATFLHILLLVCFIVNLLAILHCSKPSRRIASRSVTINFINM